MQHIDKNDKNIWLDRYGKEYYGLKYLPAWTIITEYEYQKIQRIVDPTLPTIAIYAVKQNDNGASKRKKWMVMVLGNIKPHEWSTKIYFVPVISIVK